MSLPKESVKTLPRFGWVPQSHPSNPMQDGGGSLAVVPLYGVGLVIPPPPVLKHVEQLAL